MADDQGSLGSVLAALFGGGPWGIPAQKPPLASLPGVTPMAVPFTSLPWGNTGVPKPGMALPSTSTQPIGERPDVKAAVKAAGASAVEPFGQLGRVMTGQSQDWPADLAGAAVGLAPIGPPGAGKALKAGAELATDAASRMARAEALGFRTGIPLYHGSGDSFSAFRAVPTTAKGMETPGVSAAMHSAPLAIGKEPAIIDAAMARASGVPSKTGTLSDFVAAYHGSPHDFDRFDLSKIGTGEGAQAYGHGLYFAENEGVAKDYQNKLAPIKGRVAGEDDAITLARNHLGIYGGKDAAIKALSDKIEQFGDYPGEPYKKAIDLIRSDQVPNAGKMYQVAIKAPPEHFLDWDKPLSEQHPKVQEAIKKLPIGESDLKDILGTQGYTGMHLVQGLNWHPSVEQGNVEHTTQILRDAGIPGIKYLDQGSRDKGDGTRNFVVFDDRLIDILKKYGITGIAALPAMNAFHFQKPDSGS